jgi:hypothetical protein
MKKLVRPCDIAWIICLSGYSNPSHTVGIGFFDGVLVYWHGAAQPVGISLRRSVELFKELHLKSFNDDSGTESDLAAIIEWSAAIARHVPDESLERWPVSLAAPSLNPERN